MLAKQTPPSLAELNPEISDEEARAMGGLQRGSGKCTRKILPKLAIIRAERRLKWRNMAQAYKQPINPAFYGAICCKNNLLTKTQTWCKKNEIELPFRNSGGE